MGENTFELLSGSLKILLVFVIETNHGAKDEGERGLEWTVVGESCGRNDDQVEEDTKRCETNGNAGYNLVDREEVVGEGASEEKESTLGYEGREFHDEVEVPGIHSIHLALSISTTVDERSTLLHLGKAVEPLFA